MLQPETNRHLASQRFLTASSSVAAGLDTQLKPMTPSAEHSMSAMRLGGEVLALHGGGRHGSCWHAEGSGGRWRGPWTTGGTPARMHITPCR